MYQLKNNQKYQIWSCQINNKNLKAKTNIIWINSNKKLQSKNDFSLIIDNSGLNFGGQSS